MLSRVEDFLSGSVEGVFNRLFRTGIQKVEIARRLERAMDENTVQRRAPTRYRILLSSSDYARFASYKGLLQTQLQEGLFQVARQRGYSMTRPPTVSVEEDGQMGKGDLRIETSFTDAPANAVPAPGVPVIPTLAGVAPDFTQVIAGGQAPVGPGSTQPGAPPAAGMPTAALVLRTPQGPGQSYPLNREVIHIGRHRTNDIVIREERISRFHAEIRFERGQFVLYDLGSLNGVLVNGTLTQQAILRPGDVLNIGSYSFVFERR